jgi:glutathionyl-hydroquinone reductase
MGQLIDGRWHEARVDPKTDDGRWHRQQSSFRKWVSADAGAEYPAAKGRYHLYVSYACPWAHRTLVVRTLKGLEDVISYSVVEPYMGKDGWSFSEGGCEDPLYSAKLIHELYTRADPTFTGRVTVPVLWDKQRSTIVNNESADIIRILNEAFDQWGDASVDLRPKALRAEIEEVNARVYGSVNDGVYRCGFASTQEAYEEAFDALFETLDWLEERLSQARWLVGGRLSEADVRLWTTLARFDAVYLTHFKCNLRRLTEYPNLWGFTRDLYQQPGLAKTLRLDHIKEHYFKSHEGINPKGIVPKGPLLDFQAPHDRAQRFS